MRLSERRQAHDDMIGCRDRVYRALVAQMDVRSKYQDLSWVEVERDAVTEAANAWAIAHAYEPITSATVERVERSAVGHSDYASKFCLYVAEAVVYGAAPVSEETPQ